MVWKTLNFDLWEVIFAAFAGNRLRGPQSAGPPKGPTARMGLRKGRVDELGPAETGLREYRLRPSDASALQGSCTDGENG
jgi:hypothetical protein